MENQDSLNRGRFSRAAEALQKLAIKEGEVIMGQSVLQRGEERVRRSAVPAKQRHPTKHSRAT